MAITLTVNDIRTTFPEFSDPVEYPDTMIQFNIDVALLWMKAMTALSDDWAQKLALYLTAHFVYLAKREQEGGAENLGPVSSMSEGPSSISYQDIMVNSELKAFLTNSGYGDKFMTLLEVWRLQNRLALNLNG